jgi:hypothetical protein
VYSAPNYQGRRACGIFAKGDSFTFAGSWNVASLRFFAYDFADPSASAALSANPFPSVTLYDTLSRRFRNAATGVVVEADSPNLTLPSNGKVRMISFQWAAN